MRRYRYRDVRFANSDPTLDKVKWAVDDLQKHIDKSDEILTHAVVNAKTYMQMFPQSIEAKQIFENLKKLGHYLFEVRKANSAAENLIKKIW